jgi:dTDP-glucose pyrophosphorylase
MDFSKMLISEDSTILKAMQAIDKAAKQIVFIATQNKLKAVVTDGDIRRHILKGGSLDEPVSKIANYNPKYVARKDKNKAYELLKGGALKAIPVVNSAHEIIDIIYGIMEGVTTKKVCAPVVIMAGGLGTRLYPYTKILPKPLIPIGDIPIVEHIINKFQNYKCDEYFLLLNYKKNMIKSYINDIEKTYKVEFVDELIPLGTGGGLSLLKGKVDKTFFLTNCDILVDEDYESIFKHHKEQGNIITMVCAFKHTTIPYGVIELNEFGDIDKITEKPEYTFLTNTGLYLVEPCVIDELEENTAIGFPDIFEKYRKNGQKVGIYPVNENAWMDMGQFEELEEMRKRLGV